MSRARPDEDRSHSTNWDRGQIRPWRRRFSSTAARPIPRPSNGRVSSVVKVASFAEPRAEDVTSTFAPATGCPSDRRTTRSSSVLVRSFIRAAFAAWPPAWAPRRIRRGQERVEPRILRARRGQSRRRRASRRPRESSRPSAFQRGKGHGADHALGESRDGGREDGRG